MMSLQVGPLRPRTLAGIVGYSGMIANAAGLEDEALGKPPVLLVHGDADPMIPLSAFHRTREALSSRGFVVETHVSPGLGHSIDAAGLTLGERFLKRVLR
jgi:phospholipase/carboxylesterase